jgi:hypothetical protein
MMSGDSFRRRKAATEIAMIGLQRGPARDEPPDPVELEPFHRRLGNMEVAGMGRIEAATEQADA